MNATIKPRAWLCELAEEDGATRTQFVEEDPDGLRWNDAGEPSPFRTMPLLTMEQAAQMVADERKHWRTLLSRQHLFKGSCPDAENWHDRDPECPACRALGEWRA